MNYPPNNDHQNGAETTHPELADVMAQLTQIHEKKRALAQPVFDMLTWAAKRICYQPPTSGITYVLALNAGFGRDVMALNSFFGSKENGLVNEATHIYSIERSTPQHIAAKQHNSKPGWKNAEFTLEPPTFYHFLNADPVQLSDLPLPGQFHAIILRHLDTSNPDYPWQHILVNALDLLAPNGIAIITTFNNNLEAIPLRQFFTDPNYELLLHDRNPHTKDEPQPEVALDATVTVVKKAENYQKPADPPIPESYSAGIVNIIITREVFAFPLRS